MKEEEKRQQRRKQWLKMTPEEREREITGFLASIRGDFFPEGTRRAYENLRKAGLI